jgi:hypothetical protein
MTERKTYICPACGSDEVGRETTQRWNIAAQAWENSLPLDRPGFCSECGRDELELIECDESEKEVTFAAYSAGFRHGGDNGGFWYDSHVFDSWKEAASWAEKYESTLYATAREVCEGEGLGDLD